MAIDAGAVQFWRALREKGLLPRDPRVLEIGEANWYGDVPAADVPELAGLTGEDDPFDVAKAFYRGFLGERADFVAVDGSGTERALRLDLNYPLPASLGKFGVTVNSGTAEHVFDQCQVFRTAHERTLPGGLMVHAAPASGWPDHGFYNYHPGLFRDLAAANGYEVLLEMFWRHRGRRKVSEAWADVMPAADLTLYVALRKDADAPFRVPVQGRYRKPDEETTV